jgi:RNA polymerase sigma factor (sigma-70 family)
MAENSQFAAREHPEQRIRTSRNNPRPLHSAFVAPYRSDESLLERCRAGDPAAWDLLVGRYRRLVWSVILQHRMREETREDVFQQSFSALVEHIDSVREEGALAAWLTTTTKRLCWQTSARARRTDAVESSLESEDGTRTEPAARLGDDRAFAMLLERQLVRIGLERLGGKCRELLEALFSSSGEPNYALIGERLGIRVGSIGPTRARCLEKLGGILESLGFGTGETGARVSRGGKSNPDSD